MKTNLKAFTILEMLINIAIMSIIIGMVYFVYSSFAKQVSFYQMDVEEENTLSSFCLRLKADFFKADRIIGADNSFELVAYNTESIYYEVQNNYLFRRQQRDVDSLKIDKIDISSIIDPLTKESLVQKAQITTYLFDKKMEFTVAKKYPIMSQFNMAYGD